MKEETKRKRIEQELARISVYFKAVDANQRAMAQPLLQNAAFMKVALEDMQELINTEGVTEEYRNGQTQYGEKPSSALQAYNATVKNYAAVIKTLAQLLPKENLTGSGKLAGFVESMKKLEGC